MVGQRALSRKRGRAEGRRGNQAGQKVTKVSDAILQEPVTVSQAESCREGQREGLFQESNV